MQYQIRCVRRHYLWMSLFGYVPVNHWSENRFFFCYFADAGGLANGNMFGNFARWNEPSRDLGKKVDYSLRVSPTSLAASQKMMPILGESVSSSARLHIQVLHILQGRQGHPKCQSNLPRH